MIKIRRKWKCKKFMRDIKVLKMKDVKDPKIKMALGWYMECFDVKNVYVL